MRGFSTNILFLILGLFLSFPVVAQQQEKEREKAKKEAREFLQKADAALGDNNFPQAEAAYRKAIAKDPENSDARYNMGNMYYTRENAQAAQRYKQAAEIADTKTAKHKANHNLGNAYMKQKKYQEAVDAYKDALRNDPTDDETRYNLALAKKMLEQEQEQEEDQDGGDDEDQDQEDQDQDEQDQDQENQDEQDQGKGDNEGDEDQQDQDQEEQEGDQDEEDGEGDQEEQDQEPEEGQPQPQPSQGQLSPEQIQSLLEAMSNEERKVQDKINAEKQKGAKVKSEKDW